MYTLLSWNVIKGLDVTSPGIFVLAAFVAGFSKRYFLQIVRAVGNEPAGKSTGAAGGRAAVKTGGRADAGAAG